MRITLGDLPTPLLLWLRCHFPRVADLRDVELRRETRLLFDQLHPGAPGRRIHLLPHWLQRLLRQDPAAVELLCRQLIELTESSRRGAAQRARELRGQWERIVSVGLCNPLCELLAHGDQPGIRPGVAP